MVALKAVALVVLATQVEIEALGWTKDGRAFVFTQRRSGLLHGVIRDAATLVDDARLIGSAPGELSQYTPEPPVDRAGFQQWLKEHPLARQETSPDGRRAARVATTFDADGCRGLSGTTHYCRTDAVKLEAVTGPRAVLAGDDLLLLRHGLGALAAIDAAGFVTVGVRRGEAPRTRTTVYGDAAALAEKLGGTLEKLTWKEPNADVVVALGSSIEPAAKVELASTPAGKLAFTGGGMAVFPLGWTKDERFFAVRIEGRGCCDDPVEESSTVVTLDAESGAVTYWSLLHTLSSLDALLVADTRAWLLERAQKERTRTQWELFTFEHPLAPPPKKRVKVDARAGTLLWKNDAWLWKPNRGNVEAAPLFVSGSVPLPSEVVFGMAGDAQQAALRPITSPAGKRVAWVIDGAKVAFGSERWSLAVTPASTPAVELVADARATPEQLAAARRALTHAGFTIVSWRVADAVREQTAVYVPKGKEPDGADMVKVLPGARVEPLTWKAQADVVVAIAPAP